MGESPELGLGLAFLIFSVTLYKLFLHPCFFSPLSRIPSAHPTASLSSAWILWVRYQFCENRTLFAAHRRHGPVIRLGPNEVSVNAVDNGLRTIYAGGFEKHAYYPNLFKNYHGVPNMFSTASGPPHAARKKMISYVYSKSFLQNSASLAAVCRLVLHHRFLPKLEEYADWQTPVNALTLFGRVTMDLVTGYQFGLRNSSNFVDDEAEAEWWLDLYQSRKRHVFWPQELPGLTDLAAKIGIHLSPKWVSRANDQLEDWCLRLCDSAEKHENADPNDDSHNNSDQNHPQDIPVIYRHLKASLVKEAKNHSVLRLANTTSIRLQVASELLDHLSAGQETSSITLTFLFYELAQRPDLQKRLRDELLSLTPPIRLSQGLNLEILTLPPPKELYDLVLLDAVIMETLRRHAAIPGPQPRQTPPGGATTLGTYQNIPPGVRVSANAFCLHRNESVFPDPDSWLPERWLDEKDKTERSHWFWAFGSGGRMCIGSNLAMHQMKLISAAMLTSYRVELAEESKETPLVQEDAYTAQPEGGKLMVKLIKT